MKANINLVPGASENSSERQPKVSQRSSPWVRDLRMQLHREGSGIIRGRDVLQSMPGADATALVEAARQAPPDPYDEAGGRHRNFGRAILFPWSGDLVFLPPHRDSAGEFTTYLQDVIFNPEQAGRPRRFANLPARLLEDATLKTLVLECFDSIPKARLKHGGQGPILVGLHVTCLRSDGRRSAVATPEHAHRDGEVVTHVILVERHNVGGGANYVASNAALGLHAEEMGPSDILRRVTLTEQFDLLAIDDERVCHHVEPVLGMEGKPGHRSTLLIDFSELEPLRTPLHRK